MNNRKFITFINRSSRSRGDVHNWMLSQASDALSHCRFTQQQQQCRQLASMILITKLRFYDSDTEFTEGIFLHSKSTMDYDPWKPPTQMVDGRNSGYGFGESDRAGSPYTRHPDDPTDDDMQVEKIDRLIHERNVARRDRNFDSANSIRTQLKSEYGVVLNDQERTWSTNLANVGRLRPVEDYGPMGHDYKLSEQANTYISPFSEDLIHSLIAERLQCKLSRNFDRADAIEKRLNDAHVQLDDRNKLWRPDGKRFASGVYDYSYASEAGPIITKMPVEQIKALLRERLACRFNRDFITADRIREELKAVGIYIEDVDRLWRGDGQPFPKRVHNPREGYDEA